MKSTKYISIKFRKTLAFSLLFYFILSPLLFAFPSEECSSNCTMDMEMDTSTMYMSGMGNSSCAMMMNETASFISYQSSCDIELSVNNCMIEEFYNSPDNFVITHKYQSKSVFAIVSTVDQYSSDNSSTFLENTIAFVSETSPPIYISVQSFII